jgi:hypothetical protein
MTFEELDQALPNGFHDAMVRTITVDYAEQTAVIAMHLLVGIPGGPRPDEYRQATLKVSGLCYFWIEPPDAAYPFLRGGSPIDVAGYPDDPEAFPALNALLPVMPKDTTCFRFFVHNWNSFIHIAARDAQISWTGDGDSPRGL